jgi:hypothetical protein
VQPANILEFHRQLFGAGPDACSAKVCLNAEFRTILMPKEFRINAIYFSYTHDKKL